MPPSPARNWYVRQDGKTTGPLTEAELREDLPMLLGTGTEIRQGNSQWYPAATVSEKFQQLDDQGIYLRRSGRKVEGPFTATRAVEMLRADPTGEVMVGKQGSWELASIFLDQAMAEAASLPKVRVQCPHCQKKLAMPASLAGSSATCPSCSGTFQVPGNAQPYADATPQTTRETSQPSKLPEAGDSARGNTTRWTTGPAASGSESPAADGTPAHPIPKAPMVVSSADIKIVRNQGTVAASSPLQPVTPDAPATPSSLSSASNPELSSPGPASSPQPAAPTASYAPVQNAPVQNAPVQPSVLPVQPAVGQPVVGQPAVGQPAAGQPHPAASPDWDDLSPGPSGAMGSPGMGRPVSGPGSYASASASGYMRAAAGPRDRSIHYIIPGIGFIMWGILGALGIGWNVFRLAAWLWLVLEHDLPVETNTYLTFRIIGTILGTFLGAFMTYFFITGGIAMLNRDRDQLTAAKTASVLAAIPCFGCVIFPLGIWACLNVFSDHVRRDFR